MALVLVGLLTIVLLGDAVVRAGWDDALLLAPWMLLIVWLVYVTMYASHIAADPSGATVQNLLRVIRMPWRRVEGIAMRWQVVFTLDDGTLVKSFGGPVAGRPARPGRRAAGMAARSQPPAIGDLQLLRELWDSADDRDDDAPHSAGADGAVTRTWDVWALVSLVAIAVWAVIALIIVHGSF